MGTTNFWIDKKITAGDDKIESMVVTVGRKGDMLGKVSIVEAE